MTAVEIELDVPEGVQVRGYERIEDGHVFEVSWPLPETFTCEHCRRSEPARVQYGAKVHVIRDLDLWGQPSFFVYQPPFHCCRRCNHRQWLLPPFKRKHVTCTYRFEQEVLRRLIGSTEEEVARRLGISAEMVGTIVRHQLQDEQTIDPQRRITDVGLDEISLKKRHKLYATVLTDLTDPQHPRVLAVAAGKDQKAAEQCLERLSPEQRRQVQTHRTDMSPAFAAACRAKLPCSQQVIDRFHVAKKLGEAADRVRKKDPRLQGAAFSPTTQGVPVLSVGVPHAPGELDGSASEGLAGLVREAARSEVRVPNAMGRDPGVRYGAKSPGGPAAAGRVPSDRG
jgi:transposase